MLSCFAPWKCTGWGCNAMQAISNWKKAEQNPRLEVIRINRTQSIKDFWLPCGSWMTPGWAFSGNRIQRYLFFPPVYWIMVKRWKCCSKDWRLWPCERIKSSNSNEIYSLRDRRGLPGGNRESGGRAFPAVTHDVDPQKPNGGDHQSSQPGFSGGIWDFLI